MTTSSKQIQANQANATLSTGPRTQAGKAQSCMNATRHGLFSQHLLLEGEQPKDYNALMEDLQWSLRPVGVLEETLVERISVNMWRQRRLVQAETARLNLERKPTWVAKKVSRELNRNWDNEVLEEELIPYDKKQAAWCESTMKEFHELSEITLKALAKEAPTIHRQLVEDAESDGETLEEHLAVYDGGLQEYVTELVRWGREELAKANQRPQILATAKKVQDRQVILPEKYLELLTRYQTSLDNQLYKAMKALREAQEWRLKTLEGDVRSTEENAQEAILSVA